MKRRKGRNSMLVSAATLKALSSSTRIATSGSARNVTCVPNWLIVSAPQRERKSRCCQRPPGRRIATRLPRLRGVIRTSPLTVRTRRFASGPSARVGVSLTSSSEPTEPLTELTSSLTRSPRRIATTTSPETAFRPTSPGPAARTSRSPETVPTVRSPKTSPTTTSPETELAASPLIAVSRRDVAGDRIQLTRGRRRARRGRRRWRSSPRARPRRGRAAGRRRPSGSAPRRGCR